MHASGYCQSHEKNMSGLENPQSSAECPRVLSFLEVKNILLKTVLIQVTAAEVV